MLTGPGLILYALDADHRDRPTLEWPKVSGRLVQCYLKHYWGGRTSDWATIVTYTYAVNGHEYIGNQIALWSDDLDSFSESEKASSAFAATHRVGSAVDVYYEPEQPGNAVLIPGPDVQGNRTFTNCGCAVFVCGLLFVAMNFKKLAATKSAIQARQARQRAAGSHRHASLPHGFASYEPACKRKLNIFPDQQCLDEVLGHRGKPLQDWKPQDRIINAAGCEYRLVKEPGKKGYNLDPTGQTWTYDRLLSIAEEDDRASKKKPEALRDLLSEVPGNDRMAVLMKALDEKSRMPRWFESAFLIFLVLFMLACAILSVVIFEWVANHWL